MGGGGGVANGEGGKRRRQTPGRASVRGAQPLGANMRGANVRGGTNVRGDKPFGGGLNKCKTVVGCGSDELNRIFLQIEFRFRNGLDRTLAAKFPHNSFDKCRSSCKSLHDAK